MSSPVILVGDDNNLEPKRPPKNEIIEISDDDDEVEAYKSQDIRIKRETLIRNLFALNETKNSSLYVANNVPSTSNIKKRVYVKPMWGVKIHLPVDPYACQMAVMSNVLRAIDKRKNCLLESPTGTGKTLALLCSVLAWQKREKERIYKDQAKIFCDQHPVLEQVDGAFEYIASPKKTACESAEMFFEKKVYGERTIYDTPPPKKQNPNTGVNSDNVEQKISSTVSDGSQSDGLVKLHKNIRRDSDLTKQHLQEKPSTSKMPEITELETSKEPESESSQKNRHIYRLVDQLRLRANQFVDSSLPTIYYGTRTHKQIEQIVKELRKTSYCGDATMAILSSRNYSCIREFDRTQWRTKYEMCRSCVKGIQTSDSPNKTVNQSNCKYYDNRKALSRDVLPPAFDLEDLIAAGREITACPFYAARQMAETAEIVFCPYNYLIEPVTRKSMRINLKNNIVIIDEGHNIEDFCREAATLTLLRHEVNKAIVEMEKAISFRYANDSVMSYMEKLLKTLKIWDQWFENQTPLINAQPVNGYEAVYTWKVEHFVETLNNHNIGQQHYSEFHESAEVFFSRFRDDPRTLKLITYSTASLIEKIDIVLGFLFRCSGKYIDDFKPVLIRTVERTINNISSWRTSEFEKMAKTVSTTLYLICLNPAVVFEGLRPARCIILASGTLTPQISLESELATEFSIKISTNHIVPSDRVWIGSLSTCQDGSPLECMSRRTDEVLVQDAVGQAVRHVCSVTPYGVLCFFPSYAILRKLTRRWKQTNLWDDLEAIKHIFGECGDSGDHNDNMGKFYQQVETDKGALLLAVCRGKEAEGMDFKDQQARAVITIGVPYPNFSDINVKEKMAYNDKYHRERSLLKGSEWYDVQAFRALNQALGRCVRHIGDWGAILLIDARFSKERFTTHLPRWVKHKLSHNHHTFNSLINGENSLKLFMENMTKKEKDLLVKQSLRAFRNLEVADRIDYGLRPLSAYRPSAETDNRFNP